MKGFKDFVMRGNLIELAVAFVIGASFATVIYFFVVKPYEAAKSRFVAPAEEAVDANTALLTEIRDELRRR